MQTADLNFLVSSNSYSEFKHFSFLSRSRPLPRHGLSRSLTLSCLRRGTLLSWLCFVSGDGKVAFTTSLANSLNQNSLAAQNLVTEKHEDEFVLQPRRKLVASHSQENPLRCGWRP